MKTQFFTLVSVHHKKTAFNYYSGSGHDILSCSCVVCIFLSFLDLNYLYKIFQESSQFILNFEA